VKPELADWLEYLADIGYPEAYAALGSDRQPAGSVGTCARRGREEGPEPASRRTELATIAEQASTCTRCSLAAGRKTVVFGSGDPNAELMFIGEGPGAEEDRQGLPFVGPAGQLLTRIIEAIELTRDQVYIANIIKCRPPRNRDPLPDEVAACRPWLEAQIRLVRPRVIVALGRVAAQTLLGEDTPIGRLRGRWHSLEGIPLMPTYHPAALLRNAGLKRPLWEDMQKVRERLRATTDPPDGW
jgi:DNA polymerase